MKKTLIITGIIGLVVCVLVALFYLFIISGTFLMFTYFAPNPPKPEITYGEFPFTLTYEIDGKIKTMEDTLYVNMMALNGLIVVGKNGNGNTDLRVAGKK